MGCLTPGRLVSRGTRPFGVGVETTRPGVKPAGSLTTPFGYRERWTLLESVYVLAYLIRGCCVRVIRHTGQKLTISDLFSKDEQNVFGRFDIDGQKVEARVSGVWWGIVLKCRARASSPAQPAGEKPRCSNEPKTKVETGEGEVEAC